MTFVTIERDVRVPMRDGVTLACRLYHTSTVHAPILLTMSPYGLDRDHKTAMRMARHGYGVALVDCRGRGDSEGNFDPSFCDADDGFDTVEYLAKHPLCDGRVAMFGGSYQGENQWATAAAGPPHLAAIAPAAATYMLADTAWRGPARRPYMLLWLMLVSGRSADFEWFGDSGHWEAAFTRHFEAGAAFRDLPNAMGGTAPWFETYIDHPAHDPFWQRLAIAPDVWAKISLPVLSITGLCDDAQIGALSYAQSHEAHGKPDNHSVVIGPWDHAGTRSGNLVASGVDFGDAAAIDLTGLTLAFFDWHLRGGEGPDFLQDRITYFDPAGERWLGVKALSAFSADMSFDLQTLASGEPTVSWMSDPTRIDSTNASRLVFPASLTEAREPDGFTVFSPPFETQTSCAGWPRLTLTLSTPLKDADLEAILAVVRLDGSIRILGEDRQRLRYRDGIETECFDHGSPVELTFGDFPFMSETLAPGDCFRLTIRTSASIHVQRNFQGGGSVDDESALDCVPGDITLHLAACTLSIPVAP